MSDGLLLESIEGLDSPPAAGAMWELLQGEKEQVCREICSAGPVIHVNGYVLNERDACGEFTEEIDLRHRAQLENRLRKLLDAQDRLTDGLYGRCEECGEPIQEQRLAVDPATTLCVACQTANQPQRTFRTMSLTNHDHRGPSIN